MLSYTERKAAKTAENFLSVWKYTVTFIWSCNGTNKNNKYLFVTELLGICNSDEEGNNESHAFSIYYFIQKIRWFPESIPKAYTESEIFLKAPKPHHSAKNGMFITLLKTRSDKYESRSDKYESLAF